MNLKRAEEIINSKGVIQVTYNNSPVWIESISRDDSTAHVKFLESDLSMNIPVQYLNEAD